MKIEADTLSRHAATQAKPAVHSHLGTTALVLDSPHSGTDYPDDFGCACDLAKLRDAEDTHVEKLYAFAADIGAAWIEARFPRSYLDANRAATEVDASMLVDAWSGPGTTDPARRSKLKLGKGLIWRCTDDGTDIYQRKLTAAEVLARIDRCWVPYHRAVRQALDRAYARHGYCIHINCHSMPSVASRFATDFPGLVHPDFVIGDLDGTAAASALSQRVCERLRGFGYEVSYNHPYKGVELLRANGDPARHRHSIQIEVNRDLYMDETTRELHGGAHRLRRHLRVLMQDLATFDPRELG